MRVNWFDKEQVIAFAKRLGEGQTVYRHPMRANYNITHTERFNSRSHEYKPDWIVYQS